MPAPPPPAGSLRAYIVHALSEPSHRTPWMRLRIFGGAIAMISNWPCTAATNCTTVGSRAAGRNGNRSRHCSSFGAAWKRVFRGNLARYYLRSVGARMALFEMTSTQPSRRYGMALRRLGFGRDATHFFDEHVLVDSAHEAIAVHDLAGRLAADEPALGADVLFGARALGLAGGGLVETLASCKGDGRLITARRDCRGGRGLSGSPLAAAPPRPCATGRKTAWRGSGRICTRR